MRFMAMMSWLALPLAAYGTYVAYGLPHMIWSYSFHDNGDRHDPFKKRDYIDCTFWGPYGRFTVPVEAGRCGWIAFFQPSDQ